MLEHLDKMEMQILSIYEQRSIVTPIFENFTELLRWLFEGSRY